MASGRQSPAKLLDLELTVICAKHLKNVNWKIGDLKPYAVFWIDPDRRLATKSDESGSTRPVWNERFTLPLAVNLQDSCLTLEIFHSKPSETPKPLVGTLRLSLKDLPYPEDVSRIRSFELIRPSGRPQGKIKIKLGLRVRPLPPPPIDYHHHVATPQGYYYNSAPPPPRDYRYGMTLPPPPLSPSPSPPPPYTSYHDPYASAQYYPGYYSRPPPPPGAEFDRVSHYSGPSAPVDCSSGYDQRQKGGKMGFGSGLAVGAVAGGLGALALDEGLKYEEEKIGDRVENDLASCSDFRGEEFRDYRHDY
ncbi:Calcium-dependent lipid-binding (CaLB domain) family protein [Euphorbia peplus]|nr:Calcium-dependent lipid-binding (CaLB domain) family protein [Euphorbia peplus]